MGDFDMAVGKEIVSVFAGAADYNSFPISQHKSKTETIRAALSEKEKQLNALYKEVREIREKNLPQKSTSKERIELEKIFQNLKINHPSDWLLPLEIYELISETDSNFAEEVLKYLLHLKTQRPKIAHLIDGGLELLSIKTNETI